MSATDLGKQTITFDFRQDATSANFNKYNNNIVKPGIYKGGRVYFQREPIAGGQFLYYYIIERFSAAFSVAETSTISETAPRLLVNISTSEDIQLQSSLPTNTNSLRVPGLNNSYYIVVSFDWVKTLNNYIDFRILDDINNLSANELVICRIKGNGANNKPDFFYDVTSFGDYYQSYDDKFTTYGTKGVDTNYGKYTTNLLTPRKLIPFSSDSYYLKLNAWTGSDKYEFITFQPFNGEIELVNKNDLREKIKFIFDVDDNISVIASAKTKLVNNSNRVVDHISYYVDSIGRLQLYNGYTAVKEYILKANIYNISRRLNVAESLG